MGTSGSERGLPVLRCTILISDAAHAMEPSVMSAMSLQRRPRWRRSNPIARSLRVSPDESSDITCLIKPTSPSLRYWAFLRGVRIFGMRSSVNRQGASSNESPARKMALSASALEAPLAGAPSTTKKLATSSQPMPSSPPTPRASRCSKNLIPTPTTPQMVLSRTPRRR